MAVPELEPEQFGKLVALEGDSETIDTQLRLLPPSQKILIIPALPDTFSQSSQSSDKDAFDARTFVRDVHSAFTERSETARTFLRSSTSTQPRLVIQNGGSVGARAKCILKIASTMNGDIRAAETMFSEIVKDGVAGLTKQDIMVDDVKARPTEDNENAEEVQHNVEESSGKAMKAADSLDRKPEALQPSSVPENTSEHEKTLDSCAMGTTYSTSIGSVPLKGSDVSNLPEKVVLPYKKGDDIVRTVLTVPSRTKRFTVEEKRTTFGTQFTLSTPEAVSTIGPTNSEQKDEDGENLDFTSPKDESMLSAPPTPAVYEEAFLVDVQSGSPKRSVKKTQSVDTFSRNSGFLDPSSGLPQLKHTTSDYHLRRPTIPERRSYSFQTLPRTTFVKASQTTIRKSPTGTSSNSSKSSIEVPRVYVDRGEDAFQISHEEPVPFEPVFPVLEDLIINLIGGNVNEVVESVISSYKDGTYPAIAKSGTPVHPEEELSTVTVVHEKAEKAPRPEPYLTAETDDMGYERRHEYDPYNDSYPPDIKQQWPPMQTNTLVDSTNSSGPPTPTMTPPAVPEADEIARKFVDFTPTNPNNAINVQNSLRQLLGLHFPAEKSYSQHYYPVASEAERLWKPVFRNDQNTSIGNDGRNVDQIIALGCEDGVKKDFFFQISGQVERLGTKRDGANRSGKLDIRYLISNAMQHFSCSTQNSFNPLSNPQVVAAILVPQIEAYLAINTTTRLLILHYPSSHLPIVLALRTLLGSDLLKIAGILDTLASDPPSMSRPRTPNLLSNETISLRSTTHSRLNSSHRTRPETARAESITSSQRPQTSSAGSVNSLIAKSYGSVSFATSDYLLPSTATDAEITTFLSSIWKALMEKSAFYTPEPEPKPIIVERPPMPPPPTPTGSSRTRMERERDRHREREKSMDISRDRDTDQNSTHAPSFRHANSQSKISRLTGGSGTGPSAPRSNYSPSIISTSTARPSTRHRDPDECSPSIASTKHKYDPSMKSTKYAASIASTKSEKERRKDKEWENFYIGDEDSEDDAFDRMILGRAMQRIVPEPEVKGKVAKRDKKKALKWLGLA